MKCISKAFALPCEGRNVQAEDAQRLAIELALEHWPQQLNRRISPVSTGVLSAVLPQRIWFREAVFKLDHQVLTFALLALRVRNANNA
jgi:hypothetical protein